MECKVVQDYLDGTLTTIDTNELQTHLEECSVCSTYKSEMDMLEEDLSLLYQSKVSRPDLNKKIINKVSSKKRTVGLTIAASFIILFMTFNTEITSFAEKIPFIQDIMTYFSRDHRAEFSEDNGYPIQEFTSNNGDYKLLVRDVYVDTREFRMQFALLDEAGKVPENMSVTLAIPGIIKDKYSFNSNPNINWQSFSCDVTEAVQDADSFIVNFDIRRNDKYISSEVVEVDTSHLTAFEFDDIDLSRIIELPTAKIEIISVNFGPAAATIKYKAIEQYNSTENMLDICLVDSNGKIYRNSGGHWSSDSPVITAKYDYSNLDQETASFKLLIAGYSYRTVTSVGNVKDGKLGFSYKDTEFDLKLRLSNGSDQRGLLYTDELINAELFPILAFKEGKNWISTINTQQVNEFLPIGKDVVVEALGENYDVYTSDNIEKFVDFVKETKGIELDLEFLKRMPGTLNNPNQMYLKTTREFFDDETEVQWNSDIEFEGLEFGIIGEFHFEMLDLEIEIKPD